MSNHQDRFVVTGNSLTGFAYQAVRTESSTPVDVRRAVYPNGRVAIQGAYRWSEGLSGGVIWRDLPTVYVESNGQEVVNEG